MENFAWFNGQKVAFTDGQTILQVAKQADIFIPTLCAFMPLNHTPGTCRMCLVEVFDEGDEVGRVVTACTTPIKQGQRIFTRNERVRKMQQLQMQLLFADHDQDCKSCSRHGNCELQDVALFIGMPNTPNHSNYIAKRPYDDSSMGIIRDVNKCIRCGRCVEVCRQVQGIGALTIDNFGTMAGVAMTGAKRWADSTKCVQCGQCTLVCPTGALSEKDETDRVLNMIDDPETVTIVQMAPAVRVTLGEEFGLPPGENVEELIVYGLKHIGVDYIMDTNFAADVVIMEEGTELLERLKARKANKDVALPMFTSCCPGWINYVEKHAPMIMEYLSTTRSPQAVFGALAKALLPQRLNIAREKLRVISIMPCTAKKMEAERPNSYTKGEKDTDIVITTTELTRMIRTAGIALDKIEAESCDMPFGIASGAGVIFGVTGGVTEAVIRRLVPGHGNAVMDSIAEAGMRGEEGIKEFSITYEGKELNICVASGLANARKVMEQVQSGEKQYHLIEIMACRRGCIMGGGQPIPAGPRHKEARAKGLYRADGNMAIKKCTENPLMDVFYNGEDFKGKAHELLHNPF